VTSSFDERDTILRLAKRIGEVLGKAVQALLGKRPDEAQEVLEAGCGSLLGIEFQALSFMESATAAGMLQHPARIMAYAKLLQGLADVAVAKGNEAMARSHAQHALEVALEALRRERDHAGALALVQALVPRVDVTLIPESYRATLVALPPA
jgi:hypothetical protein